MPYNEKGTADSNTQTFKPADAPHNADQAQAMSRSAGRAAADTKASSDAARAHDNNLAAAQRQADKGSQATRKQG
jgi:hypothetical protein